MALLIQQISIILRGIGRVLAAMRTALNSFPLFELLLRIKEPSRLPGKPIAIDMSSLLPAGIHFVLHRSSTPGVMPYIELKVRQAGSRIGHTAMGANTAQNSPKSFHAIFGDMLHSAQPE